VGTLDSFLQASKAANLVKYVSLLPAQHEIWRDVTKVPSYSRAGFTSTDHRHVHVAAAPTKVEPMTDKHEAAAPGTQSRGPHAGDGGAGADATHPDASDRTWEASDAGGWGAEGTEDRGGARETARPTPHILQRTSYAIKSEPLVLIPNL
jgi:hypothetical protein